MVMISNKVYYKLKKKSRKRSANGLFLFYLFYLPVMCSTAFPGEKLSKKERGEEVFKNCYRDTPTIRVGSLPLDKGGRTPPVSRYSAFSFHHLADSIRPKMINPIRLQKYSNNKYNKLRPVIRLNRKSHPER